MVSARVIHSNGILAETGAYGATVNIDELYEEIISERGATKQHTKVFLDSQQYKRQTKTLGPPPSVRKRPNDLAKARWGIVLPQSPLTENEQLHFQSLRDLITHRQSQMGGKEPHIFHYQSGWCYDDFLWAEGRELQPGGIMQPDIIPYYLCIVGSPERIPWEFQQYMDSDYAVGRLWFDDPKDCSSYIQNLITYELEANHKNSSQEVLFVGTQHENDAPTQSSATHLIHPLHNWLTDNEELHVNSSLLIGNHVGSEALKENLLLRLKGNGHNVHSKPFPSLLFTASHGLEYQKPSDDQYAKQGALLCQNWPGGFVTPTPSDYIGADDITEDMDLSGGVAVCFACFSAGTPVKQDWVYPTFLQRPRAIAKTPFVARLPQKMLANGLLAFVGHVSKSWDYSFLGVNGSGTQWRTFSEVIEEILIGNCIGHSTDYLNDRWGELTMYLDMQVQNKSKKEDIVSTWIARNDCRGYVILGDPAVRLAS